MDRNLRHDLMTCLNQILGYAEILREDASAENQNSTVADLDKILAAARRMRSLIEAGKDAASAGQSAPEA